MAIAFLSASHALGMATGAPLQFSVDPPTVRQREKAETPITAIVTLKVPAPSVFVCRIRSGDGDKVSFGDIIFKIGQRKGSSPGLVHWNRILKDDSVKVAAFSTDAPDQKLWFTVSLKISDEAKSENSAGSGF